MSATPVQGQSNSLLEVGGEALALRHGLEALVRTLNPAQKTEFVNHLRGLSPSPTSEAYNRVYGALARASQ